MVLMQGYPYSPSTFYISVTAIFFPSYFNAPIIKHRARFGLGLRARTDKVKITQISQQLSLYHLELLLVY